MDADGACSGEEVCLIWTDHHTAAPVHKRVELFHIKPVSPRSKGEHIVILSGSDQGQLGVVETCKKKSSEAVVSISGRKVTYPFSQICRVTSP